MFPPQFYNYGNEVLEQMDETNIKKDMESALMKFAKKDSKATKQKEVESFQQQVLE